MYENILRHPDLILIDGAEAQPAGAPGTWQTGDVTVRTEEKAGCLGVVLTALRTPVKRLSLRWHAARRLRGDVLGDAWERSYADLGWQHMTGYQSYPWYMLLNRDGVTAGYGVRVRPSAICSWQADPAGITLRLDVRSGGEGVELNGRELHAAEVVCREYEGIPSFEAARRFCGEMCADPLLPPAPVYGANNWYYAYGRSSREEVLGDAAYLAELTRGVENRPYFVIDDCWQRDRYHPDGSYEEVYNGGPWVPNGRFGDMGELAREIAARGVIPGIWVRLLQDHSDSIPADWRLPHTDCLDPSRPEVLAFVAEIVDRIGRWGYKLLKHDFSTYDITARWGAEMQDEMTADGWHFADRGKTTAEVITGLYRAILEAAQPHGMLVLGCNTVGHLGAGLMHLNRTGDDTSGLMWERTLRFGVNTLAFRMPQHRTFFDIDADCIGISPLIPWKYNRQWGDLLSRSGTSFFYSVKPHTMPTEEEREFSAMLRRSAVPQPPAVPLDWAETSLPQEWRFGDELTKYDWYEPCGLRVACANGPVWERVWKEVSRNLG